MEEESLSGTILSEEKAFWQGVASHEVCAGARKRLRFLGPEGRERGVRRQKGVNAKEKVAQKVESNSKKPHMAAGELSERKFEAENTAEKMEVSDENNQVKAVVQSDEVEWKRKEMEKSSDKVQETV